MILALSGCGGVDGGGSGNCTAPQALYSGTITELGAFTMVVGDTRFDFPRTPDSDCGPTLVLDNADPADYVYDNFQLQAGMHVEVEAMPPARPGVTRHAAWVTIRDDVIGPVDSVDPADGTLVVTGQAVVVDAKTVYGGLPGLAAVVPGQVLRIYGLYDAVAGRYRASRVEVPATPPDDASVSGDLANLDPIAQTFTLGGATVSYAGVPADQLPALADGLFARVHLQSTAQPGQWNASSIRALFVSPAFEGVEREATIEAVVSTFTDASTFTLPGVVVDAHGATSTAGTTPPVPLAAGVRVRVHGAITASSHFTGAFVADQVTVLGP